MSGRQGASGPCATTLPAHSTSCAAPFVCFPQAAGCRPQCAPVAQAYARPASSRGGLSALAPPCLAPCPAPTLCSLPSPPPSPPPAPPSFPKCRPVEEGTEFEGGDIRNGLINGVRTPAECCGLCFARPECAAYSLDRSSRQCMLKAAVGWRRTSTSSVASAQLLWPRPATCAPRRPGVYLHGCIIQSPDAGTDIGGIGRAAAAGQASSTPTSRALGITGVDASWQECCALCAATAACAGGCRPRCVCCACPSRAPPALQRQQALRTCRWHASTAASHVQNACTPARLPSMKAPVGALTLNRPQLAGLPFLPSGFTRYFDARKGNHACQLVRSCGSGLNTCALLWACRAFSGSA